jgi:hypothetical protein
MEVEVEYGPLTICCVNYVVQICMNLDWNPKIKYEFMYTFESFVGMYTCLYRGGSLSRRH